MLLDWICNGQLWGVHALKRHCSPIWAGFNQGVPLQAVFSIGLAACCGIRCRHLVLAGVLAFGQVRMLLGMNLQQKQGTQDATHRPGLARNATQNTTAVNRKSILLQPRCLPAPAPVCSAAA